MFYCSHFNLKDQGLATAVLLNCAPPAGKEYTSLHLIYNIIILIKFFDNLL